MQTWINIVHLYLPLGVAGMPRIWYNRDLPNFAFNHIIYRIHIINWYQKYVLKVLKGWIRKIRGIHGLQLILKSFLDLKHQTFVYKCEIWHNCLLFRIIFRKDIYFERFIYISSNTYFQSITSVQDSFLKISILRFFMHKSTLKANLKKKMCQEFRIIFA